MSSSTRRRRVVVIRDKRESTFREGGFEITIGVLASLIGIASVLVFAIVYCWHVAHAILSGFPVELISVSPLDIVPVCGSFFSVMATVCISTLFLVPPLHVSAEPNADGKRSSSRPFLRVAGLGLVVFFALCRLASWFSDVVAPVVLSYIVQIPWKTIWCAIRFLTIRMSMLAMFCPNMYGPEFLGCILRYAWNVLSPYRSPIFIVICALAIALLASRVWGFYSVKNPMRILKASGKADAKMPSRPWFLVVSGLGLGASLFLIVLSAAVLNLLVKNYLVVIFATMLFVLFVDLILLHRLHPEVLLREVGVFVKNGIADIRRALLSERILRTAVVVAASPFVFVGFFCVLNTILGGQTLKIEKDGQTFEVVDLSDGNRAIVRTTCKDEKGEKKQTFKVVRIDDGYSIAELEE